MIDKIADRLRARAQYYSDARPLQSMDGNTWVALALQEVAKIVEEEGLRAQMRSMRTEVMAREK